MNIFLAFLFILSNALASDILPLDWVSEGATQDTGIQTAQSFDAILQAQGDALEKIDERKNHPLSESNFKLTELITNFVVTKSGLLGVSAMRASNALEVKWKKAPSKTVTKDSLEENTEEDSQRDFLIEEDQSPQDMEQMASSILKMVEGSGKVKTNSTKLKTVIHDALVEINNHIKAIQFNQLKRWEVSGLRVDFNFSSSGQLWYFTRAGVALRLRMEWRFKSRPLPKGQVPLSNERTRFIVKVLDALNKATESIEIKNFEMRKISVGIGGNYRIGHIGLWRNTIGFIGFLNFLPVKNTPKNIDSPTLPSELIQEDFTINGDAEDLSKSQQKNFIGKGRFSHNHFIKGMQKSLKTASFFAQRVQTNRSTKWRVSDLKTLHDLTFSGFLGLADFTSRGSIEIDLRRK